MVEQGIYTVGGTVQAGGGLYIPRAADAELLALCRAATFAYVLAPRQMGKSSLMLRTAEQLAGEGIRSVIIDLTSIGVQLSAEKWYLGILFAIKRQLKLKTDVVAWWQTQAVLSMIQRLILFFQEVLLAEIDTPVVIFVDEIDTTLSLDFTDDFYTAIRYLYNVRAQSPAFQRLSFVLIGVATPGDLIRDPQRTPFNIGQRVDLIDFTFEEARPLADGLGMPSDKAEEVLRWALDWTGGHPYLTQRLCRVVTDKGRSDWSKADVDRLVASTFFGMMSEQDNNLQFVRDMLTRRAPDSGDVLTTYREIRRSRRPVPDEEQSLVKSHLKLSGVVCREHATLRVRNPIYWNVFDDRWIREHLPPNYWSKRLRRTIRLAALFLVISIGLGLLALYTNNQRLDAVNALARAVAAEKTAEARRQEAETAKADAIVAQRRAETERTIAEHEVRVATARQLAAQARDVLDTNPPRSLLLSVEALSTTLRMHEPRVVEAEQALREALAAAGGQPLVGHTGSITAVAISPDGHWLVTGSDDATARLWDLTAQDPRAQPRILRDHTKAIRAVTFSPDGHWLVTGSEDHTAQLRDLTTTDPGAQPVVLEVPGSSFNAMAISPDNHWLATGGGYNDDTVHLWDLTAKDPATQPLILQGHTSFINAVVFSADSRWLATGSNDHTARLWNLSAKSPAAQSVELWGHTLAITAVAISPDSHWLVTGSDDDSVRLWDLTAKNPVAHPRILTGHTSWVRVVVISPSGHWLVTGSYDHTARLWDLSAKDPAAHSVILSGHTDSIYTAAFSPDSHWLITGSGDHTARLWNLTTNNPAAEPLVMRGHSASISAVVISHDGHWLVTGSADTTARLWDLTTKNSAVQPVILTIDGALFSTAISPDSHWLIAEGYYPDGTVPLWDLTTKNLTAYSHVLFSTKNLAKSAYGPPVISVSLVSSDNHWLVTRSSFGADDVLIFHLWDLTNPTAQPQILTGYPDAISRDGHWLVTGSNDHIARLWDLTAKDPTARSIVLSGHTSSIHAGAFSPNSHWLITEGDDQTTRLWNLTAKDPGAEPHMLTGSHPVISPDNHWLVTTSDDQDMTVQLWDLSTPDPTAQPVVLRSHTARISAVTFSRDSRWIITTGDDRDTTVQLWDLTAPNSVAQPHVLTGHIAGMTHVSTSPDSHWLIATGNDRDKTVQLWDLTTPDSAVQPHILTGDIAAISSDSHWLITTGDYGDNRVWLWDLTAPDPTARPHVLTGYTAGVGADIISPDSHWLITGSDEHTARLWDLTAREPAAQPLVLRGNIASSNAASFSRDGHWLITISDHNTVRVLNLRLDDLIALACSTAGRNLTQDEWQQFIGADQAYHKTCPHLPTDVSVYAALLQQGQIDTALAMYADDRELNPTLDPPATMLVNQAADMIEQGLTEQAMAAYAAARQFDPAVLDSITDANRLNHLCRRGSLAGQAATVLTTCEHAVALAPNDGAMHDSRGLARALSGDSKGAIEDFQTFLASSNDDTLKAERRAWIAALAAGRNPFDQQTLQALQSE